MKRYRLSLLLFLGITLAGLNTLYAQQENIWAFGRYAGLDFNISPPTPFLSAIETREGAASISDSAGKLLFYTEGSVIWDRNHNIMANGDNLTGLGTDITMSTTQGAVIVPMPGSTHLYYVFSLGSIEFNGSGRLWYSIVDMNLNNGLGAVVNNKKTITLDKNLTEKMIGIAGNNCDVWLVVVPQRGKQLKAYPIGLDGLDTVPVISALADKHGLELNGWIDASPDRKKIFITNVLYDFNPDNGTISNPIVFSDLLSAYGVCFSPNGSKLYRAVGTLMQYDLSLPDSATIAASGRIIGEGISTLRRGPDQKIYTNSSNGNHLGIIHNPDLQGAACKFEPDALKFTEGSSTYMSLPNYVPLTRDRYRNIVRSRRDTLFCLSEYMLKATANNGQAYSWSTGDTLPNIKITTSGTYWVNYQVNSVCTYDTYSDTFHVYFDDAPRPVLHKEYLEIFCREDTLLLSARYTGGTGYNWNDGSKDTFSIIRDTGIYWVNYHVDSFCSINTDSFIVSYTSQPPRLDFRVDSLACVGAALNIRNQSDPAFTHFHWQTGDGFTSSDRDITHRYAAEGVYEITLTGLHHGLCRDTLRHKVTVDAIVPVSFTSNRDSLCVGEFVVLTPHLSGRNLINLHWQYGIENGRNTNIVEPFKAAFDTWGSSVITLTAQFRICPDITVKGSVFVAPMPLVHLIPDTAICFNGNAVILEPLSDNTQGNFYLWSTGATTAQIRASEPGTYRLNITNSYGCNNAEEVTLKKGCYVDIPNAFTPNGDGINDYFFPRQLLSAGISSFQLKIYDRWGQTVFETFHPEGRGWDGRFNGEPQKDGVYMYQVDISFLKGKKEHYHGNVTLIR